MITQEMRGIVGKVMRESLSLPVSASDIAKWAMAVYWPEPPPPRYWAQGEVLAPEEFNPFAWITRKPTPADPPVLQTAFSERELGVEPPPYKAMLLTEIKARYGEARIAPGDVIRSTYAITDYFEREGRLGAMLYTTLSHSLFNPHDAWIRTVDSVFVRY